MNYAITSKYYNPAVYIWLLTITAMVLLIIVIGGLTRLTDSGLSMTDWRPILGVIPPLSLESWLVVFEMYKQTTEYKIVNKNMTLIEFKYIFWWEWFHRFFGRLIGLCFLLPLIYFSFKIKLINLIHYYLIFLLICFQGFIGWYMVSSGLVDRVDVSHYRLSVHLLIAFLILSLIGIFGGTAAILFIYSYRLIAASKIAVFEYLAIPSSFILAWIFFGEAPFDQLFPGVLLIVFAGMIIIWRDKNKKINKPN